MIMLLALVGIAVVKDPSCNDEDDRLTTGDDFSGKRGSCGTAPLPLLPLIDCSFGKA